MLDVVDSAEGVALGLRRLEDVVALEAGVVAGVETGEALEDVAAVAVMAAVVGVVAGVVDVVPQA
jgi:hypothetical protein